MQQLGNNAYRNTTLTWHAALQTIVSVIMSGLQWKVSRILAGALPAIIAMNHFSDLAFFQEQLACRINNAEKGTSPPPPGRFPCPPYEMHAD